jgi:hypothetical protein
MKAHEYDNLSGFIVRSTYRPIVLFPGSAAARIAQAAVAKAEVAAQFAQQKISSGWRMPLNLENKAARGCASKNTQMLAQIDAALF